MVLRWRLMARSSFIGFSWTIHSKRVHSCKATVSCQKLGKSFWQRNLHVTDWQVAIIEIGLPSGTAAATCDFGRV
jgi:hypothetical protein